MRKLILVLLLGLSFNQVKNGDRHSIPSSLCWVNNILLQKSNQVDSLQQYKQKLAILESSNDYSAINSYGYMGKYQFSKKTLRRLNFSQKEIDNFLNSKELQERAIDTLTRHNESILRGYGLASHVGSRIEGITITMNGMLAGAHLRGPYSVKKFIESNGTIDHEDGYGTRVSDYLKLFQN